MRNFGCEMWFVEEHRGTQHLNAVSPCRAFDEIKDYTTRTKRTKRSKEDYSK
jgi:hypothetical protein